MPALALIGCARVLARSETLVETATRVGARVRARLAPLAIVPLAKLLMVEFFADIMRAFERTGP
jgi:hypothetical protein